VLLMMHGPAAAEKGVTLYVIAQDAQGTAASGR
jgi:hypothetical protein